MATLRNVDGRTLVPNTGSAMQTLLNAFAQKKQQESEAQDQADIAKQIEDLLAQPSGDVIDETLESGTVIDESGALGKSQREKLIKLIPMIGSQASNAILSILDSRDDKRIQALQTDLDQGAREAFKLQNQPDFESKRRLLTSMLIDTVSKGGNTDKLQGLLKMDEDQLDLEILSQMTSVDVIQKIALERSKPKETFTPVRDAQGSIIGQISSLTGKAVSDPRAQTPLTSIGKARKDLREGLISKEDFNALKKAPGEKFKTNVGKLINDKQVAVDIYGEGSEQVKFINDAIQAESEGDGASLSDVAGIRKEYTKLSGDFISLRDAIGKVEQSAQTVSAAGDLALIFNFMRIQDPSSVVRESEFATAQAATSLPGRIGAGALRVVNGERMIPEQRKDFVDTAKRLFESQRVQQASLMESFRNIAERQGINSDDVVIDFDTVGQVANIAPVAPIVETPDEDVTEPVATPINLDLALDNILNAL